MQNNYQILIIDDNSKDKTKEEIKKIKFENNQIKFVNFSENCKVFFK